MNKIIALSLILILIISCKKAGTAITDDSSSNFDWLVGNWIRTNEKEGKKTIETWAKDEDSKYNGFSFTLLNNDTIWQERVTLMKADGGWHYSVTGKGNLQPTVFKLTEIEKEAFICVNEANEFPKKIRYSKSGNQIKAIISGGGMEIPFEFERLSQ